MAHERRSRRRRPLGADLLAASVALAAAAWAVAGQSHDRLGPLCFVGSWGRDGSAVRKLPALSAAPADVSSKAADVQVQKDGTGRKKRRGRKRRKGRETGKKKPQAMSEQEKRAAAALQANARFALLEEMTRALGRAPTPKELSYEEQAGPDGYTSVVCVTEVVRSGASGKCCFQGQPASDVSAARRQAAMEALAEMFPQVAEKLGAARMSEDKGVVEFRRKNRLAVGVSVQERVWEKSLTDSPAKAAQELNARTMVQEKLQAIMQDDPVARWQWREFCQANDFAETAWESLRTRFHVNGAEEFLKAQPKMAPVTLASQQELVRLNALQYREEWGSTVHWLWFKYCAENAFKIYDPRVLPSAVVNRFFDINQEGPVEKIQLANGATMRKLEASRKNKPEKLWKELCKTYTYGLENPELFPQDVARRMLKELNAAKSAEDDEGITTLVVRRIPYNLTQQQFLAQFMPRYKIDFLYLARNTTTSPGQRNFGFLLVNFMRAEDASRYEQEITGKYMIAKGDGEFILTETPPQAYTKKPITVSPAQVQGYRANLRYLKNTLNEKDMEAADIPLFRRNGTLRPMLPGLQAETPAAKPARKAKAAKSRKKSDVAAPLPPKDESEPTAALLALVKGILERSPTAEDISYGASQHGDPLGPWMATVALKGASEAGLPDQFAGRPMSTRKEALASAAEQALKAIREKGLD